MKKHNIKNVWFIETEDNSPTNTGYDTFLFPNWYGCRHNARVALTILHNAQVTVKELNGLTFKLTKYTKA